MSYLSEAAYWYNREPHQTAAWDALEERLPQHIIREFKEAYRASQAPLKPEKPQLTITKEIFSELTGYAAHLFTQQECDDCNKMLDETGFRSSPELACMLLANILHETGNMRWLKELASGEAYEWRSDLGNVSPGDGPRYKGAGVLQLTGRYNYSRLSKSLNDPRVMEGCDYVASTYPFRSAVPWIRENNLLEVARSQGFDSVCVRINGGWNGISDRRAKYQICKDVLLG